MHINVLKYSGIQYSGDDLNISIAYRQILYFFDENCTNVEIFNEINIV